MELDGEAYPLADLGLDVTVTIGADGTAEMNMGGDVDHRQCAMQDGALAAGTMVFTLRDGVLSLSEDGAIMTLSREKPEAADTAIPVIDESATIEEIKGVWTVVRVTMDGLTLPAETADMAGDTLVVYGDTCDLTLQGMTLDGLPCSMNDFALIVPVLDGEFAATLREDGTLAIEMSDVTLWWSAPATRPKRPPQNRRPSLPRNPCPNPPRPKRLRRGRRGRRDRQEIRDDRRGYERLQHVRRAAGRIRIFRAAQRGRHGDLRHGGREYPPA